MQDWIKHDGSKCPVPKGTRVDVKHRGGEEFRYRTAGRGAATCWSHDECGGDIMFYRLSEPVTLAPGDYISTKGLTEDDYHAVARAFMAAGAESGEYPRVKAMGDFWRCGWAYKGWPAGSFAHSVLDPSIDKSSWFYEGRHLTIDQVLNSTNAQPDTVHVNMDIQSGTISLEREPTVIDTLRLARDRRDEARRELDVAEGVLAEAMDAVRAELGDGFVLSEAVVDWSGESDTTAYSRQAPPAQDMNDPANWREGDVVECVRPEHSWWTHGARYSIKSFDGDGWPKCTDDHGDTTCIHPRYLRFHHRP